MPSSPDVVSAEAYELGEGPRLDPRTGELLWVDIRIGQVLRGRLAGGVLEPVARYEFEAAVGAVAPVAGSGTGWVVATGRGFAHLGASGEIRTLRTDVVAEGTQMNDGACDPAGRFLAGSQVVTGGSPWTGGLYQLGPAAEVSTVLRGVGCSNGIGWRADGTVMYYVDSRRRTLDAFDYDADRGTATNRRNLVTFTDATPDGLCVDDDGCLWIAMWDGWCVRRFAPDGRVLSTVDMPVPRPTAVCLAGTTLVVTSAWIGLDDAARARAPLSGRVFALDVGVTGQPARQWKGDPA